MCIWATCCRWPAGFSWLTLPIWLKRLVDAQYQYLLRFGLVAELDGFLGVDVGQQAHVFRKWQCLQQEQWGQIRWDRPWLFLKVMCNMFVPLEWYTQVWCQALSSHSLGVPPPQPWSLQEAFESSSSQASSKEEEEEEAQEEKSGEDGEVTVQKVLESYKLESWCSVFCCRPTCCDKYCLVWTIVVQVT